MQEVKQKIEHILAQNREQNNFFCLCLKKKDQIRGGIKSIIYKICWGRCSIWSKTECIVYLGQL